MQNNRSMFLLVSFLLLEITSLNASQKMPVPALNLDTINKSSISLQPAAPKKLGYPTDRKRINSNDSNPGVKSNNSFLLLIAQPKSLIIDHPKSPKAVQRKSSFISDSKHSCFDSPTKKSVQVVYHSSKKSPDHASSDY